MNKMAEILEYFSFYSFFELHQESLIISSIYGIEYDYARKETHHVFQKVLVSSLLFALNP